MAWLSIYFAWSLAEAMVCGLSWGFIAWKILELSCRYSARDGDLCRNIISIFLFDKIAKS